MLLLNILISQVRCCSIIEDAVMFENIVLLFMTT